MINHHIYELKTCIEYNSKALPMAHIAVNSVRIMK